MSAWWQFKALIRKNILTLKRSIFMTLMEIFYPIVLMLICYLIKLAFDSTKVTWEEEEGLDQYLINKGNFGFDYGTYPHLMQFNQKLQKGELAEADPEDPEDLVEKYISKSGITDASVEPKLLNILQNLSPDNGIWKYIDPLKETHDIPVSTIAGLPAKPLTMICLQNRTIIAFVGFDESSTLGTMIKTYINIEAPSLGRTYTYKHFNSIDDLNNYITDDDYGKDDKPPICFGIYFEKKGEKRLFSLSSLF